MNYTYTFIIPHHNSPELLNRCLDSIPQREDIQIIVVDDNSLESKRPNVNRQDVEIVYIDAAHTKGAGRARNVGLEHAQGKWLLFADCDDFYNPDFLVSLDKYKDAEIDILFFSCDSCDSETLSKSKDRSSSLHKTLCRAKLGDAKSLQMLKYRYRSPWFKMVNRELIQRHVIQFEEVKRGNDVMFSFDTCYHCDKYAICPEKLYCVTYRKGSITYSPKSISDYYTIIAGLLKRNAFYKRIGENELCKSYISFMIKGVNNPLWENTPIKKMLNHLIFILKCLWTFATYPHMLYNERMKYVNLIIEKNEYTKST